MKFLFDFDDTLWNIDDEDLSIQNIKLINELDNAVIISGNTFESIKTKIEKAIGDISNFKIDIWADSNTTLYRRGKPIDIIEDFVIDNTDNVINTLEKFSLLDKTKIIKSFDKIVNIKIKPFKKDERDYYIKLLNIKGVKVVKAGRTTIDILSENNNKSLILERYYDKDDCIYFGNEIDDGNDRDIALLCKDYIDVKFISQTYRFLKRQKLLYGLIIAAGNQTRFNYDIPKALVKINDVNLLDLNINYMKSYVDKIYVVCSFNNDKYFSNDINKIVIESGKGCGDAVMKALSKLHKDSYSIIKWRRFTSYR